MTSFNYKAIFYSPKDLTGVLVYSGDNPSRMSPLNGSVDSNLQSAYLYDETYKKFNVIQSFVSPGTQFTEALGLDAGGLYLQKVISGISYNIYGTNSLSNPQNWSFIQEVLVTGSGKYYFAQGLPPFWPPSYQAYNFFQAQWNQQRPLGYEDINLLTNTNFQSGIKYEYSGNLTGFNYSGLDKNLRVVISKNNQENIVGTYSSTGNITGSFLSTSGNELFKLRLPKMYLNTYEFGFERFIIKSSGDLEIINFIKSPNQSGVIIFNTLSGKNYQINHSGIVNQNNYLLDVQDPLNVKYITGYEYDSQKLKFKSTTSGKKIFAGFVDYEFNISGAGTTGINGNWIIDDGTFLITGDSYYSNKPVYMKQDGSYVMFYENSKEYGDEANRWFIVNSGLNTLYYKSEITNKYPWNITGWIVESGINPIPIIKSQNGKLEQIFDIPNYNYLFPVVLSTDSSTEVNGIYLPEENIFVSGGAVGKYTKYKKENGNIFIEPQYSNLGYKWIVRESGSDKNYYETNVIDQNLFNNPITKSGIEWNFYSGNMGLSGNTVCWEHQMRAGDTINISKTTNIKYIGRTGTSGVLNILDEKFYISNISGNMFISNEKNTQQKLYSGINDTELFLTKNGNLIELKFLEYGSFVLGISVFTPPGVPDDYYTLDISFFLDECCLNSLGIGYPPCAELIICNKSTNFGLFPYNFNFEIIAQQPYLIRTKVHINKYIYDKSIYKNMDLCTYIENLAYLELKDWVQRNRVLFVYDPANCCCITTPWNKLSEAQKTDPVRSFIEFAEVGDSITDSKKYILQAFGGITQGCWPYDQMILDVTYNKNSTFTSKGKIFTFTYIGITDYEDKDKFILTRTS